MKTNLLQKILVIFWKQNSWHRHGVLIHTLKVTWWVIKGWEYKMIPTWLLHDIWKPFVATRDKKVELSFSFHWHEEKSYQLIKNLPFISEYTKSLVRRHYLIRWTKKALEKSKNERKTQEDRDYRLSEYFRQKQVWDSLDDTMKKNLIKFLSFDDYWK